MNKLMMNNKKPTSGMVKQRRFFCPRLQQVGDFLPLHRSPEDLGEVRVGDWGQLLSLTPHPLCQVPMYTAVMFNSEFGREGIRGHGCGHSPLRWLP